MVAAVKGFPSGPVTALDAVNGERRRDRNGAGAGKTRFLQIARDLLRLLSSQVKG